MRITFNTHLPQGAYLVRPIRVFWYVHDPCTSGALAGAPNATAAWARRPTAFRELIWPPQRAVELVGMTAVREVTMLRNRTVHVSRTLMVKELSRLLSAVPVGQAYEAYAHAVLVENVLLKRTVSNREKTLRFLRELYALDPVDGVFCVLSLLWSEEPSREGRSLLALLAAIYRDEVLRPTHQVVLAASLGDELSKHNFANAVEEAYPGRFGDASREKIGRNIAATWTQSGHLLGRYTKTRTQVVPTPATAAFAFYLGWLDGERGLRLYETVWASLLDADGVVLDELVFQASQRGWATYKRLGDVVEIDLAPLARQCLGSEE